MNPTASVLRPYLEDFERSLRERGYRTRTVDQYVSKSRTFDAFLVQGGVTLASLAESGVEVFLADKLPRCEHRDERAARRQWNRPLRLLLEHLRGCGAVPDSPAAPAEPAILREYASFLRDHRGVCEQTVRDQNRHLTRFLDHVGARHEWSPDTAAQLSAEQIDTFLVDISQRLGRLSINSACSALRGFLRYLHMRGTLRVDLAAQVMRPRVYALESLPRALSWHDVERTLAIVDRTTLVGCRDYAVLVLLAYYGMRAGEVAKLSLEDIDWSCDEIRLHRTKRKTIDHLPLLPLAGEAIIQYLRRRPSVPYPEVFLKMLAPRGPLNRPSITWIARKYLLAADVKVPHLGAHTLRHSFALRLLRDGFPLKTIGDALGHQHPQSTFIYTKAAVDDLRCVSLEITEVLP